MTKIPVYRTGDGENFVAICKFTHQNNTIFAILNILDELFSNNDLIRLPKIESRPANSFKSPVKIIGYLIPKCFSYIFWPAFHRFQDTMPDRICSDLDMLTIDEISKALDQSLSLANSEPSNSDPANCSQLCC